MEDLPGASGPMADWPRVAAVDGAKEALSLLAGRARLVLATGAADSDAAAVRRALARVGLDALFEAVLTRRELAARKPDPEFFRRALARVGGRPEAAVAIGDDLVRDVRPALAAGLAAVWLARDRRARPREARLVAVSGWDEVEAALERLGVLVRGG